MTDLKALIETTFLRWAEELEPLPVERWDAASTCEGWSIRMVVAHTTMAARYDEAAFTEQLAADGFDFGRLSDRLAAEDGRRSPEQLLADLRSPTLHDWEPPGGGVAGALSHVVIHSADTTVPLRLPPAAPPEARRVVLDQLAEGGVAQVFGVDPAARTYRATDLDWRFGHGADELLAPSAELVLALAGRSLATA